jgi:hypothetical protein
MPTPVNGDYFDWGQIELDIGGVKYDNEFEEIAYEEASEFKVLNGKGRRPKGRTRGKLTYTGTVKFAREIWGDIVRQLQTASSTGDWRDAQIDITVSYGTDSSAQSDKLKRVKLHSPKHSHSNNEEPLMTELSMSIMDIVFDGETEEGRL